MIDWAIKMRFASDWAFSDDHSQGEWSKHCAGLSVLNNWKSTLLYGKTKWFLNIMLSCIVQANYLH